MTIRWERQAVAPDLQERLYMDAVLRPHRSLSAAALRLVLCAAIVVNGAMAAVFWSQGAAPVSGLLGLDVAALCLAFWLNNRAARAEERVRVTRGCVHVASIAPSGAAAHWALNPIWARVVRGEKGVFIRAGSDALLVGAFLAPSERESFAAALDAALYRAKRGL